LRGQTIGNLKLKPVDASRNWNEDELAIIAATSERVALALEGSRLLDDAQKRATRETFLADVSAKLGASFQLDSILRDTVEELGKNLKGSTVSFQLVNPSATSSAAPQKSNGASASEEKAE
jgi:GAF domain-containing protein